MRVGSDETSNRFTTVTVAVKEKPVTARNFRRFNQIKIKRFKKK